MWGGGVKTVTKIDLGEMEKRRLKSFSNPIQPLNKQFKLLNTKLDEVAKKV